MVSAVLAAAMMGSTAVWEGDFHGFDPATFDGKMLSPDQLKAMAADAGKASPPHGGKQVVIGFVSFFPVGYANAALPTALAMLAGREVPKSVFAYADLVTPAKACKVEPKVTCRDLPAWQPGDVKVDEDAYRAFVAQLHADPTFANFQRLLPTAV